MRTRLELSVLMLLIVVYYGTVLGFEGQMANSPKQFQAFTAVVKLFFSFTMKLYILMSQFDLS